MHTHSPSEWSAALSLGTLPVALIWLVARFAAVDPADFDPRPALYPLLRSLADRVLVEIVRVKSTPRELAVAAAAFLMLFTAPEATS